MSTMVEASVSTGSQEHLCCKSQLLRQAFAIGTHYVKRWQHPKNKRRSDHHWRSFVLVPYAMLVVTNDLTYTQDASLGTIILHSAMHDTLGYEFGLSVPASGGLIEACDRRFGDSRLILRAQCH